MWKVSNGNRAIKSEVKRRMVVEKNVEELCICSRTHQHHHCRAWARTTADVSRPLHAFHISPTSPTTSTLYHQHYQPKTLSIYITTQHSTTQVHPIWYLPGSQKDPHGLFLPVSWGINIECWVFKRRVTIRIVSASLNTTMVMIRRMRLGMVGGNVGKPIYQEGCLKVSWVVFEGRIITCNHPLLFNTCIHTFFFFSTHTHIEQIKSRYNTYHFQHILNTAVFLGGVAHPRHGPGVKSE